MPASSTFSRVPRSSQACNSGWPSMFEPVASRFYGSLGPALGEDALKVGLRRSLNPPTPRCTGGTAHPNPPRTPMASTTSSSTHPIHTLRTPYRTLLSPLRRTLLVLLFACVCDNHGDTTPLKGKPLIVSPARTSKSRFSLAAKVAEYLLNSTIPRPHATTLPYTTPHCSSVSFPPRRHAHVAATSILSTNFYNTIVELTVPRWPVPHHCSDSLTAAVHREPFCRQPASTRRLARCKVPQVTSISTPRSSSQRPLNLNLNPSWASTTKEPQKSRANSPPSHSIHQEPLDPSTTTRISAT